MANSTHLGFPQGSDRGRPPHLDRGQVRAEDKGSGSIGAAVKDRLEGMGEAAADVAGRTKEKVAEWTASAGESLSQASGQVRDWAAQATDRGSETLQDFAEEATGLMRRYPLQTLLVGFAVGFLLARATSNDS